MKSFLLFITLLVGVLTNAFAQKLTSKPEIRGTVVDSVSGKPLRLASVALQTARDSDYVTATVTDGDGRFRFRNLAPGKYRLLITFLGYRNAAYFISVDRNNPLIDVGSLLMTEQSSTLDEVIVRQERAPIAVRGDTLEFNAGSFKTQPNAQVEELLRKLPGVDVSRDGTIRVQGQTISRVLVDGKPFFGNDPKMATRNLPADIVDKVQLYDQSSDQSQFSGIDDGNRERTINLTIKRDKRRGYFGQNAVGAGPNRETGPARYQGRLSLNRFNNGRQLSLIGQANNLNQQNFTLGDGGATGPVIVGGPGSFVVAGNQSPTNIIETKAIGTNYRDKLGKKAEVSASYFVNQAITTTDQQNHRQSILPEQSFTTDQHSYSQNRQTTQRFNGRLDWQLDSLTSLRLTPNISWQHTGFESALTSRSVLPIGPTADSQLLNTGETSYNSSGNGHNGYSNLLLMRKFRREGRTFSANLNTILANGETGALNQSINRLYDSTGSNPTQIRLNQRNDQLSQGLQNTVTLSYVEPLSLTRKLEFKYAYANHQNRAERNTVDFDEATGLYDRPNSALTNRFRSIFATHQAGATMQTRRLRYTYALGFDVQQAQLRVENRSIDTSSSHRYLNLLPNALFSYTFPGNRSLRLQYRTRLTAPTITQLQPVVDNTNPLNVRLGNPALRPEYYNTITLTYNGTGTVMGRSLFMFASLNQSTNRIASATTINSAGVQTTQPVNAGGYWSLNGTMSINRQIQPVKLNLILTTNAGYTRAMSFINDQINASRTGSVGQGIRLQSNYNGKLEYGISGTVTYQTATYSLLSQQNTSYWAQYATADLHWQLPFRFVLTSDLTYTATSGRSAGYNQQFTLWNMALARQFFKGNTGEIRIQVFDLLNQNRSLVRNTTDSYIDDVQSRVLRQYVLLSFVYNLRKFGVK
ncbi:TonB-dependent receptor [Spirosoma sp. SC4-14]|uniref:TonB-dependent receptor n=1 Tax=Spirosoma sp. SC4-14 TaxID=3128900 RepID=UPI0030D112E5